MKKVSFICDTKEKRIILEKFMSKNNILWPDGSDPIKNPISPYVKTVDLGYRSKLKATECDSIKYIMNNSDYIFDVFDKTSIKSLLNKREHKLIKSEEDFVKAIQMHLEE